MGNAGRRAGLTGGQCCLGGGCETAPSLKQPTTEERVLQQGVVGQRCLSRNFNEPKLHSAERQIVCRTGGGGEFLIKSEETSQSEGAIQLAVAWRAAPHTPVLGTVSARFIVERPATRVRVGSGTRSTVPGDDRAWGLAENAKCRKARAGTSARTVPVSHRAEVGLQPSASCPSPLTPVESLVTMCGPP